MSSGSKLVSEKTSAWDSAGMSSAIQQGIEIAAGAFERELRAACLKRPVQRRNRVGGFPLRILNGGVIARLFEGIGKLPKDARSTCGGKTRACGPRQRCSATHPHPVMIQ